MKTFTDNSNRNWTLSLTIGTAMTVKDRLGIDLLQPEQGETPLLTRLGTDELLLAQVLATMLESQFESHGVTPEDIYDSFDGATFTRAIEAFYEELTDFFRSRGRNDRVLAVRKQKDLIEALTNHAVKEIANFDIEKTVTQLTDGNPSGVSPAP